MTDAYNVGSWIGSISDRSVSQVYLYHAVTDARILVSLGVLEKMYREGLIARMDPNLAQYMGLQYVPNPYQVPDTTPPPTPSPAGESYILSVTLPGRTVANKLSQLGQKLTGLGALGWSVMAVSQVNANGIDIEFQKDGSITLATVILIIVGIIAVMFITGSITYTIIRKSDNEVIDQAIEILDSINQAEQAGVITAEQAKDARDAILGVTATVGGNGDGGFLGEVKEIIPLVIIIMLISSLK